MVDTNGIYHAIGASVNAAGGAGYQGSNGALGLCRFGADRCGDCGKAIRDRSPIGALRQTKSLNSRSNSLRLSYAAVTQRERFRWPFLLLIATSDGKTNSITRSCGTNSSG